MVAQGGAGVLGPGDAALLQDGHHVIDECGQLARRSTAVSVMPCTPSCSRKDGSWPSHWFPALERARAYGFWMMNIAIAQVLPEWGI